MGNYFPSFTFLIIKNANDQVHQTCLQRWVDEKQKGGNISKVTCPQCQTEYIIVFPNMGILVLILDTVDSFIYKGCPFMAAGIVVGAVYWCAVTYGAITVMQVCYFFIAKAKMSNIDMYLGYWTERRLSNNGASRSFNLTDRSSCHSCCLTFRQTDSLGRCLIKVYAKKHQ